MWWIQLFPLHLNEFNIVEKKPNFTTFRCYGLNWTSGYPWRSDTIRPWYPWPLDTCGYATPATPNALFGRHNPKFSQNNTRGSHLKAFISPQIKTILWLSAVVPTDVVRVSKPVVCTLRLSIRVFTPLLDGGEKTQNPGSDILNLGSQKFWKFPKTRSSI
jgi:hypothetical protein